MINVAILGFGVIGRGIFDIISKNNEKVSQAALDTVRVAKVVDIRDLSDSPAKDIATKDFNDVLRDESISVVVECMGGHTIAYEFSKAALMAKKSVVSSNKEVVACYGDELMNIAKENNVSYLFEASVGGGIPIIHPMKYCLWANKINSISGILNGTTNFMLTMMKEKGVSFNQALEKAQELGYAEKNADADVKGFDAARKIAILSSIVLKSHISLDDVSEVVGIDTLTSQDVAFASKANKVIKLLARSVIDNGKAYIYVAPHLIDNSNPLASVCDVFNAVCVNCDMLGDAMFYGKGAGSLPTASAVVSDIIEVARFKESAPVWTNKVENVCLDANKLPSSYYVRAELLGAEGMKKLVDIFDHPQILSGEGDLFSAFTVKQITKEELNKKLKEANIVPLSVFRVLE